jgi:hypothetical protein
VQALMISLGPVGLAALVGSAPQIDHLHIYEVPRQGSFSDVWEITAPSGCRPLDQPIRYGAPPAGFSQLREPQPLKEQTLYRVQSIGCGYVGFAYFSINDGNVRALTWEEVEGSS